VDAVNRSLSALGRFAARLAALTGWRRRGAAWAAGALMVLALPPAGLVPVLLLAVPALLWLLGGAESRRAAFGIGWWFGFGYFVIGLYWISFALLTDLGRFWWLMPLAVAALPAALALFTGLVGLALFHLPLTGLGRALAFAVIWTAAEWLRGHVLTGFPWALAGYAWVGVPAVLQTAAVSGIYGLSLLTMAVAALPAALADGTESPRRARLACGAGLALIAGLAAAGAVRLGNDDGVRVPGVRLRLVQANIDQRLKWQPAEREANFRRHLELTALPPQGGPAPTVVIWPETAVAYFLANDARVRQPVAAVTPPGGLVLAGTARAQPLDRERWQYWNSLAALDGSGAVLALYDKVHLVPFGEYLPLRASLPDWLPLGTIAAGGSDFSAGPGPKTLHLPGLPPVGPLICYEAIFPAAVADPADRPGWLLNLTNDAWYGHTAGPHQHFAITAVRAVEEGMPLVRVANTGISGVVDGYGRPVATLGLGVGGVLDADLPRALPPTPYSRFGDGILLALLGLTSALALGLGRRRAG
jgi:apolipoprotein N-acyltransferase